jgi:phage-related protein
LASRIAEAYVQIVPRIDGIAKGISGQLSGPMSAAGETGAASFAGGFKKLLGPAIIAGAALAAAGLVKYGKEAIAAGEQAATANARINQIATSMNLFGNETAQVSQRLIDLAKKQALATGVDQNAIKATQAKLLTFKEIAATAGEVGSSFDRATAAAVDLAAAGFGSAESNAVSLGKALNNPIKGITALNRQGISFTAQEQEKIKALTESNRILEAQELILQAVETQVGGTALATSNSSDRIKVAFSQVKESIGRVLLPAFDGANDAIISKFLVPLTNAIDQLPDLFAKAGAVITPFAEGFKKAFTNAGGGIQGFIAGLMDLRQKLFDAVIKALPGIITAIVEFIPVLVQNTVAMITALIDAIIKSLPAMIDGAIQLFNGVIDGLTKVLPTIIGAVVSAIPVLISAIVDALPKMIDGAIKLFLGVIDGLLKALPQIIKALVKAIPQIIKALTDALPQIIDGAIKLFLGIVQGLIEALPQIIAAVIDAMPQIIKAIIDAVPLFVQAGIDLIGGLIAGIGQAIPNLVSAIGNAVGNAINAGKKALGIRSPSRVFMEIGGDTMDGLVIGINKNASKPIEAIQSVSNSIIGAALTSSIMQGGFPDTSAPIKNFEQARSGADLSGKTIIYNAAPNQSIDSEAALFQAIRRAKVVAQW